MLIKIGFDISFELPGRTPMVLMLYTHPSRQKDLRAPEQILVEPDIPLTHFTDVFGNRCARLHAPAGILRLTLDSLIEDSGEPDHQPVHAIQHNVEDLPDETLQFLLPSRYCEVDKLTDTAWKLFGATPPGYPRVKAIFDWGEQPRNVRLSPRRFHQERARCLPRQQRRLPRLQSSRRHLLPVH